MNLREMDRRLRETLHYPGEQSPNARQRYNALAREVQSLYNSVSNTGKAWEVGEWLLQARPSLRDYLVPYLDFGKALAVVTKSTDSQHRPAQVELFDLQDMAFDWGLPEDAGSYVRTTYPTDHAALRFTFFRKGGQDGTGGGTFCRVAPTPQLAAQYTVLYSVGVWQGFSDAESEPVAAEHHHLAIVRAGLSLLAGCRWTGDDKRDQTKRENIRKDLAEPLTRLAYQFEEWAETQQADGPVRLEDVGLD